ncbi:ATP-dependent nuclease [Pleionea sediminis]|uniref:ATP-dependent nuclease n=1 Tax=Pleionea sediminis TaxID=2569479 RepID=UPI001186ED86|nr:ATP-binding protein [Pleionea sediminis]
MIKARNYKCFEDETGFEKFCRVNLIVGRNNAGKSSLLDLIECLINDDYFFHRSTWRGNKSPQIIVESKIPEYIVNQVFKPNVSGGAVQGNHRNYGNQFIEKMIKWSIGFEGVRELVECDDSDICPTLENAGSYSRALVHAMPHPLINKNFRRLSAERDIRPEPDNSNIIIGTDGSGITNAIQNYINKSNLPSELVESSILKALNSIFAHDAIFTDIVCQLHEDGNWEIYLEEKFKGRIALSQSGSGLKTVMSVLACLILVPRFEETNLNKYVFGFEELENNLHPALLRRLNNYIYEQALEYDYSYVLTTHSNVLIDQFSKRPDAQIIHVSNVNSVATCTTAKTYIENNGIIDDLDVRASDLLQANGVVWVEGPSDRIYLNKWIGLWSDQELREGTHYQIIFYGGRLLSHLSAESPSCDKSGVSILNTNRNAIILIDSDKRAAQTPLSKTKKRIQKEFNTMGALCWITKGREIENYIPKEVVNNFLRTNTSAQVGQYESFFEYLNGIDKGQGDRYVAKKPLLAEKLAPIMNKENMIDILDLDVSMENVCNTIRAWNN